MQTSYSTLQGSIKPRKSDSFFHRFQMKPTTTFTSDTVQISLRKMGSAKYVKMSYPVFSGIYAEVETRDLVLHFNLNNEIIRARGKGADWPHPHEWLKRNMGNDWIYYSTGGYTGVYEATGEYYLPNLPYKTNGMLGGAPFQNGCLQELINSWPRCLEEILTRESNLPEDIVSFLEKALANNADRLQQTADNLFTLCGGRSTVLPPDARHVDYNVIPITVATGCLYKCRFCEVKNKRLFAPKSPAEIDHQLDGLMRIYGDDLINYNGLFLGEHDALNAGPKLILYTLKSAEEKLNLSGSFLHGCSAYLFGSVSSLLNTPDDFFREIEQLPFQVYINIGLESHDQATLDLLGKPITSAQVADAFARIQDINDNFSKTEITANFVLDEDLPQTHLPAFLELVRESLPRVKPKGCVYLSPLKFGQPSRSKTFGFNRLKVLSRVPTYLYIIQRL